MLVFALAAIPVAIILAVYLVLGPTPVRHSPADPAQQAPAVPGPPLTRSDDDPGAPVPPLYQRFAALTRKLTPAQYGRSLQRRLDIAGNPRDWRAERVLALKGIGLTAGVLLGVLVGSRHGAGVLILPFLGGLLGFFLPDLWIRVLGERRQQDLRSGLPDAVDLMTLCVEAGLGFDAALSRVARNVEGPVAAELARVLQEMQLGKSRTEALHALTDRTDVAELRTFASAIVQSSELGISVGDVLREHSHEMRLRRRQRAEEQAQKLPVKILFPLLLCMLPALFVVVIGPAAINIIHTFSTLVH